MSLASIITAVTERVNATLIQIADYADAIPFTTYIVSYVKNSYQNDPYRIMLELVLVFFTIKYLFMKRGPIKDAPLTEAEIDYLIDDWVPEPLVPQLTPFEKEKQNSQVLITRHEGTKSVLSDGSIVLNLSTSNFLGLMSCEKIKQDALTALRSYGVGSCGPPGFYGTIDVHMQLEQAVADFLGVDASIIYAQGYSTTPSVIPSFSKRGDILICDEGIKFSIQRGLDSSRSTVKYYKHNDMNDLERILKQIQVIDKKSKRPLTRRYIVTEGLFENTGDLVLLPQIMALKHKYKYRLIVDDSYGFGILGKRGTGIAEHYGISNKEIDIYIGSFSNVLCSSGGFCAGSKEIVDHQRLGSSSYVFSASLPAMLAVCAASGLEIIQNDPQLLERLRRNIVLFRSEFQLSKLVYLDGDDNSPVIHIRYAGNCSNRSLLEATFLSICKKALSAQQVLVCPASYVAEMEKCLPAPSLRVLISSELTPEEVKSTAMGLRKLTDEEISSTLLKQ